MCPTEEQEVMDGRPPFRRRAHRPEKKGFAALRRFARDPLIFRRAAAFYRGGAVSLFIGGLFGSKRAGTGI